METVNEEAMTDKQLRAFLDLMMVSDPWPEGVEQDSLQELADAESRKRGYDNWIVAYHEHHPTPKGGRGFLGRAPWPNG